MRLKISKFDPVLRAVNLAGFVFSALLILCREYFWIIGLLRKKIRFFAISPGKFRLRYFAFFQVNRAISMADT
jgi:hypothetical protein